uniref:Secreted protein n=1 Tax=Tanacetum cinerariifolium TaxID=118510 RepID=A0A6L2KRH6_TANCI|nr:hypothetical protein [Tanacetum cinerariifolium]
MKVVMAGVMTAVTAAMVVWQHGNDVVVRWWREGVDSSEGCGVVCRFGWPKFWPDGGAAPENFLGREKRYLKQDKKQTFGLVRTQRQTLRAVSSVRVKENKENDKIGSKPDKNGKRGEAGKSQKQLQLKEEEKPKKTKKEWPKTHARIKSY